MNTKIAFFDIDGTLTSELNGSIPSSAIDSIRAARANGHKMFINTGRCFQNVEKRFQDVGFDGYVCGGGTNIYCEGLEIFYRPQKHDTIMQILHQAQKTNIDILFESRKEVCFDTSRPLQHPHALKQYQAFVDRGYHMPTNLKSPNFFCDKFVIWFQYAKQLEEFRLVSDLYFQCIDRGGDFREFVPLGFSKATGIKTILDRYGIKKENAYAFGDSNNDLSMFEYLQNSIAMGNCKPASLSEQVAYTTSKASEDGIRNALQHFHFI